MVSYSSEKLKRTLLLTIIISEPAWRAFNNSFKYVTSEIGLNYLSRNSGAFDIEKLFITERNVSQKNGIVILELVQQSTTI